MDSEQVTVKVNGKRALTVEQVAERLGITVAAAYRMISRAKVQPLARVGNVYDPAVIDAIPRPGKGAPGVPRKAPDARARRAAGTDT